MSEDKAVEVISNNAGTQLAIRIKALVDSAGPKQKEEMVYTGEKAKAGEEPKEGYRELGVFTFKRLTFIELDGLRLHSVNDKGIFDKYLHAGSNARMVAATLIDPSSGINFYQVEEINDWPGWMVDAFAAAANRANSLGDDAAKAIGKNSVATVGDKH